jgi:hypothetical protein
MGDEVEVPGADVVRWLSRIPPHKDTEVLVGCDLDDGDSDQLVPILGIDRERNALVVAGGRRVPLTRVRAGAVVDSRHGAPLQQAISSSETPAERQARQDRIDLGRAGIDPDRLASPRDQQAVLALLKSEAAGTLPGSQQRHDGYMAFRATAEPPLARAGARLFAKIAERYASSGQAADDLFWRRTWLLRTSGQLREAVAVSDILDSGGPGDAGARRILATTRAATLLDLFELDGDRTWVARAEKAVAVAMAWVPHDDEALNVHRRLRGAQRRLGQDI